MIPDAYCWALGCVIWAGRNVDSVLRGIGYIVLFGFTLHVWLKAFGL
jgi:hypothetical protein